MKKIVVILLALTAMAQASQPRYRLYNPNDGNHHYTTSEDEYNVLAELGWNAEGYDHQVPEDSEEGAQPYYRLYNPNSGEHFWTASEEEYVHLGSVGWTQENADGSIFLENIEHTTPLLRLYNPNNGLHYYTTNEEEKAVLVKFGLVDEGVACYVYPHNIFIYTGTHHEHTAVDELDFEYEVLDRTVHTFTNNTNANKALFNFKYRFGHEEQMRVTVKLSNGVEFYLKNYESNYMQWTDSYSDSNLTKTGVSTIDDMHIRVYDYRVYVYIDGAGGYREIMNRSDYIREGEPDITISSVEVVTPYVNGTVDVEISRF